MSTAQTLLLGAIAGLTIFLGLPMGRMHGLSAQVKSFFTATATGILLFLFWDVLSEAIDPVESALQAHAWGRFAGVTSIALAGFVVGLMSLVYYDTWIKARQRRAMLGPGAASVAEFAHRPGLSAAQWLSIFIATGIGLHNFSEGLAIGQSAAQGLTSLALVLVIGFGLHNATEGFGIIGPLAGEAEPPSWRFLGLLGVIGGAPTFVGTVIGHSWTSENLSILFFTLAAGSILYVVMELLNVCRTFGSKQLTAWGIVLALPLGRSRRRGVVVALVDEPPAGIEPVPIDSVLDELPPVLVDLALWVADYYGSTPGRALELIAPVKRKRRKEQAPPGERQALVDESEAPELTAEQRAALERITASLEAVGGYFLLYGETGSGKTEVYLQACAAALARGKTAIVLVPEIALTPQTLGRFQARFGDAVALLHSGLTDAERRDERERIARGEAKVVVGARSAIFAPLRDVGVICVDEEHDPSYKQESDPRYDARTVAAKRAALEDAVAIYGSATPRPESWDKLERLELAGRLGGSLPGVRVVDLRGEAGYPLSAPLLKELGAIEEQGGKAILLLNRRGVAPALHCRACGTTLRCPLCDVALVLHREGSLRCHHCGHEERAPQACPACGSVELARIGAGTQRLERELVTQLPKLVPIRLDADTAQNPEALAAALRRFGETDRAVLLGTQMVAKGHHFSGVSLAAVIDADTALGVPDFRADERTFQLLTQLAGRSGRDAPGRVLIQTFQPDSRPIELAARHDVPRFLTGELERRRTLGYPPFRHLVRILVSGPEPGPVNRALEEVRDGMQGAEILGPAPLFRLRGRHRAQLVAKTDEPRRVAV